MYIAVLKFNKTMESLLKKSCYIAGSQYRNLLQNACKAIEYFYVLKSSGMLQEYCQKNKLCKKEIERALYLFAYSDKLIKQHNEAYITETMISEKDYLDHILDEDDPDILLDEDQRKVVLTDEDHCLVIAGAGAGKTTTVAAKVKYLVDRKDVKPSEILVVSFTNKAVQELRDKINTSLHIPCPVTTFHACGNAILRKQQEERLNITDPSKLYYVLQEYFKKDVLKNESTVNALVLFFSCYFDPDNTGKNLQTFMNAVSSAGYSTLKGDIGEYVHHVMDHKTKKKVTIQNEVLRSYQEVQIANFLYLHGIEYTYEPVYRYPVQYARKPYTPDFLLTQGNKKVYLEHFGISEDGQNDRFSKEQLDLYKKAINDKILLHRKHGTALIYTFSSYKDGMSLMHHLEELLVENGFVLRQRSNQEIIEKLTAQEENRYIRKMISLMTRFIHNFKTDGYVLEDFDRMYYSTNNVRNRLFLNICKDGYIEYEKYLKSVHGVDFEDMINESARLLKEMDSDSYKLDFKYIIVDEYQDISRQRFDLVEVLSKVCNAKVIAVGDDWQSIYAFSGSDITLFTHFLQKVGYAEMLKITSTYRNSQEIIDIAGNFIQKNTSQITKELKSNKHIQDPVIIYTYDSTRKKYKDTNTHGEQYNLAHAVETALEQIIAFNKQEKKPENSSILLLGRFGFDGDRLERSGLFEYTKYQGQLKSVKYPFLNITFMTAHASKGLGYDNVIVVNGKNETYGFPSKIEDDPVLSFVVREDRSMEYAEERRLFYVAMTRTKNRVFFIAPEQNPSPFLLEIKKNYKSVVLRGEWNEKEDTVSNKKVCPMCGYPLQYRYKESYGLRLFMCTNEPEVCGFMTNMYGAGKLSVMKCDQCTDGYLIVRHSKKNGYFLGCTNYSKDGKGCHHTMDAKQYYGLMHIPYEEIKQPDRPVSVMPVLQKNTASDIVDAYDMARVILECISALSLRKFYNKETVTDVLQGASTTVIQKDKLQTIPQYGVLQHRHRQVILDCIEFLLQNHFLLQTKHTRYPVLHMTYEGNHYAEYMTDTMVKRLSTELNE